MSKAQTTIILFLLITAVVFGVVIAIFPYQAKTFWIAASGWVLFCVRVLYEKWDRFYLAVQKLKYQLFGLDTIWNLTVNYGLKPGGSMVYCVRNGILNANLFSNLKITELYSGAQELRSEGIVIQLIEETDTFSLHVFDIPVTYRRGNNVLKKIIIPLFDEVEKVIHPESKSYFLSVKFHDKNPFCGLYMSKIAARDLISFDVTFMMENNRVEVHKDKIIIQTKNIGELIQTSKDIFAISPQ